MDKLKEEQLLLYATYTILYLNDTACNCIKELQQYVDGMDKESKKIYGALSKRANKYFEALGNIVDNSIDYLADYCSEMDDLCYSPMLNFKNALYDAYKEHNIDNSEYYTQVETMRSMVELAIVASKKVIASVYTKVPKAKWLNNYIINEIGRVANNFADWSYRKVPKDLHINLNDDCCVMKHFREMSEIMVDFKSFHKAYTKAIEYEQKRKSNN